MANGFITKCIDKFTNSIESIIRKYDRKKREKINQTFSSVIDFLFNKDDQGLRWLDQINYLKQSDWVESIKDIPAYFSKGRERKLIVKLVQTNYRISKNGKITILEDDDIKRCKSYEFTYLYYKYRSTNDNDIKLYFVGYNIIMKHDPELKTKQIIMV